MAGLQRKLVHKQFNSPMGLYSQENVKATLNRELKAFGADGIEIDEQITKPLNLANSAVLRAVEEEEQQVKCGDFCPQTRQSRSRQREGEADATELVPHHALHQQLLDQIKTQYLSQQHEVCIDRDTVLKINRLSTRRHLLKRDHSWPPVQPETEVATVHASPSHSIEALCEKFSSATQQKTQQPVARTALKTEHTLLNFKAESENVLTPQTKGFSAPETRAADADIGLVAPKCEYYEQLNQKRPATPTLRSSTPYRPRLKRQAYSLDRGRARKRALGVAAAMELPPPKPRNGGGNGIGVGNAVGNAVGSVAGSPRVQHDSANFAGSATVHNESANVAGTPRVPNRSGNVAGSPRLQHDTGNVASSPRVQRRSIKLATELKICYDTDTANDGDSEEEPKANTDIDLEAMPLPATPTAAAKPSTAADHVNNKMTAISSLPRTVVSTAIDSLAAKQQQQLALALAQLQPEAVEHIIPVTVSVETAAQPEQLAAQVQQIYSEACNYLGQDQTSNMTPANTDESTPAATYVSATSGIKLQRQDSANKYQRQSSSSNSNIHSNSNNSSCIPTPPPLPPPPPPPFRLRGNARESSSTLESQVKNKRRQGNIYSSNSSLAAQHEAHLEIAQLEAKYAHIQQSITEHLRQIDAYMENAKTALQRSVKATPTVTPPTEPPKTVAPAVAAPPQQPNELWDMFASRQSPILAVESPLQSILRQIYCRAAGIQLQPKEQQLSELFPEPEMPAENVPIVERALEDLHKIAVALDSDEHALLLHVEHKTTPTAVKAEHVVIEEEEQQQEEAGKEVQQEEDQDFNLDYRHVSDVIANYEQLSTGKETAMKTHELQLFAPKEKIVKKEQMDEVAKQEQQRKARAAEKQQQEQEQQQRKEKAAKKEQAQKFLLLQQEKLKELQEQEQQEKKKLMELKEQQKKKQEREHEREQEKKQEEGQEQKQEKEQEREQYKEQEEEQEREQAKQQEREPEREQHQQQKSKDEQETAETASCAHEPTEDNQGSWCAVCGECRESPHGWGKINKADQWRFDNLQNELLANYKATYEVRSPYVSRQISWEETQQQPQQQQQSQPQQPQQQQPQQLPKQQLQRQRSEIEIVTTPGALPTPLPLLPTSRDATREWQLSRSPSPLPLRKYPAPLIDTAQRCSSPFGLNAVHTRATATPIAAATATVAAAATAAAAVDARYTHVPQLEGHNIGLLVRTATEPLQLCMSASSSMLAATPPATPRCNSQPPPFDFLLQHGRTPQSEFQSIAASEDPPQSSREFSFNRSFDNVSPRPYIVIEGYKRVAWPPASEERIVREFTPQPQQSPAPGSGGYYPQATAASSNAAATPPQGPIYNNVQPRTQQQQYAPQQHTPQQQPPQQPPQQQQQPYQQQPAQNVYGPNTNYAPTAATVAAAPTATPNNYNYPQQPIQYTQAQFNRQPSREPADNYAQQQQQPPQQQQQQHYQPTYQQQQQQPQHNQAVDNVGGGWKHIGAPQAKSHQDFTAAGVAPTAAYPSYQQQQPPQQYQQQQYAHQQQQYQAPPSDHYQQQQPQQPAPQQHWQQQQPPQHQPPQAQVQPQYQAPYQTSPYQQHQQQHQQQQPPQNYAQQNGGANYAQPQYNSYSQPQQLQPHQQQQQLPYSQDQTDQQQSYRGASPGIITLRKETPVSQSPAPVYTSQPAAVSYQGGSKLRGDLKWPPPEYKEAAVRENEERRLLALGPVCRPRRVNRDYTGFFAKNQLNCTYPSYKVPPGTQHMFA